MNKKYIFTLLAALIITACAMPSSQSTLLSPDVEDPPGGERVHQITLVTGDVVTYTILSSGRAMVDIEAVARPPSRPTTFTTEEFTPDPEGEGEGGQFRLYPGDVQSYIHAGVLDRALFNIPALVEQGFDDVAHDGLPLILMYRDDVKSTDITLRAAAIPGSRHQRTLASINAAAVEVPPNQAAQFWAAVTAEADGRSFAVDSGLERIVLDRKIYPALNDSVPFIGAPAAWKQGYTGQGVTVAVVDTGIDENHPDFVGRIVAEANFTNSDTVSDRHGHGTHVTGIVAGSGAASGGLYTGVAFDASLMNAKVIGDTGSGQLSWVIAGMEWAAEQGADVINASVSDETPSNGADPLSQAVNGLSEQHDVLFVISAGNEGLLGDHTVTAPGAADAALTVGSVNKSGQLAPTSSVGPRLEDFAIKPDITAPGVDIVSARAAGSELGPPVDDDYMLLSGTSMAAPHVAGAAAILLQQRPGLAVPELKATLVTTAVPNDVLDVYHQGGGRLDVSDMVNAPVLAAPAPLDLGFFEYPHDDTNPVTSDVTYTNWSSETVTLDLSLEVVSREGDVPEETMLSVSPTQLVLDPEQLDLATVTLDIGTGEPGLYGGYLVAAHEDQVVTRTPVGFYKEPERYTLTVEGIRRDGVPAGPELESGFRVLNVEDASIFSSEIKLFTNGVGQVRVPPGIYSVLGLISTPDPAISFLPREWVIVGDPEVVVDADKTIVLDAREANEITFGTPEETERVDDFFRFAWWRQAEQGGGISGGVAGIIPVGMVHPGEQLLRFAEETATVTHGDFELLVDTRLAAAGAGPASPLLYDLGVFWQGHIPADLHYEADPEELAAVVNRLHSDILPQATMKEIRHFIRPWQQVPLNASRDVQVALERTEYLVGGDTLYWQRIDAAGINATSGPGLMQEPETFYEPGERRQQTWFKRPMRAGVREIGPDAAPVVRDGDTLVLLMPEWVDAYPGHFGFRHTAVDTTAFRLFRDGEQIASTSRPRGEFPMVPELAEYRMELDVQREAPWQTTSIEHRTAWTFRSQQGAQVQVLPLMLLDYDIDLDLGNNTTQDTTHLDITARYQEGAAGSPPPRVRLWTSRDDGATWEQRNGHAQGGGRYRFPLADVHGVGGFVSLRAEAFDSGGNRIDQEIIRAYAVPEQIPPPCPPNCPDS